MHVDFSIPRKADVIEVGPRDGFQNIEEFIPTDRKVEIILAILQAGIKEMEVTSFVHPKAVPQMADAAQVIERVMQTCSDSFRPIALVPNLYGARKAYNCGIRDVTCVISASQAHNQANVSRTVEQSLQGLEEIIQTFPDLCVRLAVATAFGCPFEGKIEEEKVLTLIEQGLKNGIKEIVLCDTIGVANPVQVGHLSQQVSKICTDLPVTLHLHDTRGMGIANIFAGLLSGISRFEVSVGGLGGCPFAPGAAGNTATEDTLNMLENIGVSTSVDQQMYQKAVELTKRYVKSTLPGHMSYARHYKGI